MSFWDITFLGLLGSVTGVIALIITFFSYKYNTPSIVIDRLSLSLPPFKALAGRSTEEMRNSYLGWELDMWVRNSQGGKGSIEKPNLVIKFPKTDSVPLFSKQRELELEPRVHDVAKQNVVTEGSMTRWDEVSILDSRHFNLEGGSSMHERLSYMYFDAPEDIYDLTQNFQQLEYSAVYHDNRGKRKTIKITKITEER